MGLRRSLHSIIRRLQPPEPKPLILMYHRIAEEPVDPWALAVAPARFEEQLLVLRRTRHLLPLMDFIRQLMAGTLPAHSVAVTFDDGYADNLMAAKPRLAAADVPATVFLITGYLDRPGQFWWDELAALVLREKGAQKYELRVGGHTMHFDLRGRRDAGKWRAGRAVTRRKEAYLRLWQALQGLDEPARQAVMSELRVFAGPDLRADSSRAMTRQEVLALIGDRLITIGAHTVTHPILTELEIACCTNEIMESRRACEALSGAQVSGFAYPYGKFDPTVRSAIESAGFAYACSTRYGPVTSASDVLALPRLHVLDWNGDSFERALRSASAYKATD
jgi:peptidoglycan/xylan/chitin deacetylase (PgdA/CDA1 family)